MDYYLYSLECLKRLFSKEKMTQWEMYIEKDIEYWLKEKCVSHHYNYCLKEAKMIIEYCKECQQGVKKVI